MNRLESERMNQRERMALAATQVHNDCFPACRGEQFTEQEMVPVFLGGRVRRESFSLQPEDRIADLIPA